MTGRLARILATELSLAHEREAMERSMAFHEGWLEEFLGEVGPYAVGELIEHLCLSLDVCQQKLEIERRKHDTNN